MVRVLMVRILLAMLTACGTASHTSGPRGGSCWPIAAFRIEALEHGTEWEPVFEVRADGSVYRSGKRDTPRARFSGDAFTILMGDGERTLTCGGDHVVVQAGTKYRLPYDERDALTEGESTVYVAADGEVHKTMRGHVVLGPGGQGRARVVGDVGRIRRAAEMVLFVGFGL